MRRRKARAALALCTAVAALCVAPSAASAAGASLNILTLGKDPRAGFTLEGRNGYTISVRGLPHRVFLSVTRGDADAIYIARGRTTRRRIEARFGDLGRVAVRFKPSRRVKRRQPPGRCRGRDRVTRFGVWVGRIEFVGEHAYTGVDALRARGSIRTFPRWRCPRPPSAKGFDPSSIFRGLEWTQLSATNLQETVNFGATRIDFPGMGALVLFSATASERRPSMQILRSASTVSRPRTFALARDLDSATVTPPAPFRGEAAFDRSDFRQSPYSPTWTGPLSVSLPGLPNLALTGPTFTARLLQFDLARLLTAGQPHFLEAPLRGFEPRFPD
jgi:hypothetical protein